MARGRGYIGRGGASGGPAHHNDNTFQLLAQHFLAEGRGRGRGRGRGSITPIETADNQANFFQLLANNFLAEGRGRGLHLDLQNGNIFPYEPAAAQMNDVINTNGNSIVQFVNRRENPEFRTRVIEPLEDLRTVDFLNRILSPELALRLRNLPYGYATNLNLAGASIREIRDILELNELNLNEYAISGWGYDCIVGKSDVFNCQRKEFRNINLVEINFELANTFHLDARDYLEWIRDYRKDTNASDLSTWILYGEVTICRMNTYPSFAQLRFRTAGFDRFIPFNITFSVIAPGNKRYTLFIPGGGDDICIHTSIKWALEMNALEAAINPDLDEEGVRNWQEDVRVRVNERMNRFIANFKSEHVENRMTKSSKMVAKVGENNARRNITKDYERMIKHGYSDTMLKRFFTKLMSEERVCVRFGSRANSGNIHKNWYEFGDSRNARSLNDYVDPEYISLLQLNVDGSLVTTNTSEVSDTNHSMLAHAIAIHPSPTYREPRLTEFMNFIESHLRNKFNILKDMSNEKSLTREDAEILEVLVNSQNNRNARVLGEQAEEKDVNSSLTNHFTSPRNWRQYGKKIYVIAFDIETVENVRGVQNSECVYEPFVMPPPENLPPPLDANDYSIPQAQIPYTVQWGLVDMRANASPPFVSNVVIEYGRTVFGKCLLGKCVTDFMDSVRDFMLALSGGHGKVKCFAYAHNASGFDAYIMKLYNHKYRVKKMLATPRGILSLCFDLGHGIDLIIRDTKVFFQATLKDLCTIFKVPARFTKTDFPITLINARNYDVPEVQTAVREYMENDVYSLSMIVHGISSIIQKMINNSNVDRRVPAITRFVTLMSLVKKTQSDYFTKTLRTSPPLPVDVGALRKWISYGNVGGRVMPFWRGYASGDFKFIIREYLSGNTVNLKSIHYKLSYLGKCMRVLDVTSLYPYVMANYPMPCLAKEPIAYLTAEESAHLIDQIYCEECIKMWTSCLDHRRGGVRDWDRLGLGFILVENLTPPQNYEGVPPINICPRKLLGGGLVYSYESDERMLNLNKDNPLLAPPQIQCYTHWDLYWMKKQGFTFDCVGGMRFATSYEGYSDYINSYFEMRKEAKKVERIENLPKSMSTFIKLMINGGYGVNAQRDITSSTIVVDSSDEGELRDKRMIHADEYIRREVAYTHRMHNNQWVLRVEKSPYSCEYYAAQSPNHIGAAVVATARHHVNLALWSLMREEGGMCSYTDTDSLCAYMETCKKVMHPDSYDESAEAPMGTYKNDHESGVEEIVVASFILRKKVKLHVTLDGLGQIRFYPTFTGFNPSPRDPESGDVLPSYSIQEMRVRALSDIFFNGEMKEHVQTEFRRCLHQGVTIDNEAKISGDYSSFWHHSAGGLLAKIGSENEDYCEKLIPLGCEDLLENENAVRYGRGSSFPIETKVKRNVFWSEAVGTYDEWTFFLDEYYRREREKHELEMQQSHSVETTAERLCLLNLLHKSNVNIDLNRDSLWPVNEEETVSMQ